jgi:RNA polymerase sigma factor (sigma-70 family)
MQSNYTSKVETDYAPSEERKHEARSIVYVVDDDESVCTAIQRLLRAAGYETRAYASAGEFLVAPRMRGPQCLVLDIHMPGPSGLDLQAALARSGDPLPIIFVSGQGDIPASVRAMKAGAADFLTKPVETSMLLGAIHRALAQDAEARAARENLRVLQQRYQSLTPRERQVLEHVVTGKMNKEIAAELGISERTIKAHRASIMEKMRASSVAELVRFADCLRRSAQSQHSFQVVSYPFQLNETPPRTGLTA